MTPAALLITGGIELAKLLLAHQRLVAKVEAGDLSAEDALAQWQRAKTAWLAGSDAWDEAEGG